MVALVGNIVAAVIGARLVELVCSRGGSGCWCRGALLHLLVGDEEPVLEGHGTAMRLILDALVPLG